VFFNDPDSERAGVIRLDGWVQKVNKYDSKHPGTGSATPGPGPTTTLSGSKVGEPTQAPIARAAPTPGRSPSTTPPAGPVHIEVDNAAPRPNELVNLRVASDSEPDPVAAVWSFGDGTFAAGVRIQQFWKVAGVYRVTVQATLPGGRHATAMVVIPVTGPPKVTGHLTVTVNNAGGSATVTSQPAGINCPPNCGADFAADTPVALTARPGGNSKISGGINCARWRVAGASSRPGRPNR